MRRYAHEPTKPRVRRARRRVIEGPTYFVEELVPGWWVEWTSRSGIRERRWFPRHPDAIGYVDEHRVGAVS